MTWIWTLHRAHNKSKSSIKEDNIWATFKGTTLFGGELAKIYRANKELASSVTLFSAPHQTYFTKPYTGCGKSFKKGGSFRRGGRDRGQSRSTPLATVTRQSKSGDGQATILNCYCASRTNVRFRLMRVLPRPNVHVETGSLYRVKWSRVRGIIIARPLKFDTSDRFA